MTAVSGVVVTRSKKVFLGNIHEPPFVLYESFWKQAIPAGFFHKIVHPVVRDCKYPVIGKQGIGLFQQFGQA